MKNIVKIVLTGGPCAAKTSSLALIRSYFSDKGYKVIILSETATELMLAGIFPSDVADNGFQKARLKLQMEKEAAFLRTAEDMEDDNILIVCDRGVFDSKCYMSDNEFNEALSSLGASPISLRESYDAVFFLTSAAKGNAYSLDTNPVRTESPEKAASLDNAALSAWVGHPHLRVIPFYPDVKDKYAHLIKEISSFLGIPKHMETERKFLIEYPNTELLLKNPFCKAEEISQTYLLSEDPNLRLRVRKRGENGEYVYYKTAKTHKIGLSCEEYESRISEEEYLSLLNKADPSRATVNKTRYCLVSGGKYFEIDVFPFWNDKALMEIELLSDDEEFTFPPEVKVICEVSSEKEYSNASIAKMLKN